MVEGVAHRPVGLPDIADSPSNLGEWVVVPVPPGRGHLPAGESLWDAVGTGGRVEVVSLPTALTGPQNIQTFELVFPHQLICVRFNSAKWGPLTVVSLRRFMRESVTIHATSDSTLRTSLGEDVRGSHER